MVPVVSAFLQRGINKGLVEVTGVKANRGAAADTGTGWKCLVYITSMIWIDRQTEEACRPSSE